MNDLRHARDLAKKLKTDNTFYEHQSQTAKNNFNVFFKEEDYTYSMKEVIKEVINEK